jgi:O-antigen/teichoic acid export membrane protein
VLTVHGIRRLLGRPLVRSGLQSYAFTASILVLNLATGILTARVLDPGGRGELTAVITVTQILVYLFAMGSSRALAYHQARHPEDGGRLLGTWLMLSVPSALLAIAAGELLLPTLFAAQSQTAIDIGRVYLLTILLSLCAEPLYGVLLGDEDFLFWNVQRLAQPALTVVGYVGLWLADRLTVEAALVTLAVSGAVTSAATGVRVIRRHGLARPDAALARTTFWYGLRAHGETFTALVNARLDLLIMPAFLGAASVGLYSVATSLAWIVAQLAGVLWWIVLPATAKRGEQSQGTVVASVYATLAVAGGAAIALAAVAGVAVELVYGSDFAGAVEPLRLMLPGVVFQAMASMLAAGIAGSGYPFTATLTSLAGAVLTAVGLLLFLRSGGLNAASLVTSAAYAVILVLNAAVYRRISHSSWRDLLASPMRMSSAAT